MASAMKNVSHRQRLRDDLAALRYMALVPPHSRIRISEPSARLQALVKVLKAVQRKHHYSTAMGNSWQVPGEAAALERISTPAFGGPPIQTLCEIGFNAGHSAAALLLHNNATLHEFDTSMSQRGASNALGVVRIARRRCLASPRHISPNHLQTSHISYDRSSRTRTSAVALKWSTPCMEVIQREFPGRVVLHKGDSRREGPAFAARVSQGLERPCDVFFIDGRMNHASPCSASRTPAPHSLLLLRMPAVHRRPCYSSPRQNGHALA